MQTVSKVTKNAGFLKCFWMKSVMLIMAVYLIKKKEKYKNSECYYNLKPLFAI